MENKIIYRNIPDGANEEAVTTANNKQDFVDMEDLKRDIVVPHNATLEKNRWKLNTNIKTFPNNPSGLKYMSKEMSNDNGYFNNHVILTRTYQGTYTTPRNKN